MFKCVRACLLLCVCAQVFMCLYFVVYLGWAVDFIPIWINIFLSFVRFRKFELANRVVAVKNLHRARKKTTASHHTTFVTVCDRQGATNIYFYTIFTLVQIFMRLLLLLLIFSDLLNFRLDANTNTHALAISHTHTVERGTHTHTHTHFLIFLVSFTLIFPLIHMMQPLSDGRLYHSQRTINCIRLLAIGDCERCVRHSTLEVTNWIAKLRRALLSPFAVAVV